MLKSKKNILFIFLFFYNFSFSQENNFEIINNDSLQIKFSDSLNEIRFKYLFKDKFLNGKKKIIYKDNSSSELNFIDGYPNGEWVMLDSLDNKTSVTNYLKGRKHGKQIYLYPYGVRKLEANFINGYQEGKTFLFYPNGILGGEFMSRKGKKHGIERWFDEFDGKTIYKAYYLNNIKVDSLSFYSKYKGNDIE